MSLTVKVWLDDSNQKTMKFMPAMSVSETIKEIRDKTDKGGSDHGLFQPAGKDTTARWLKEERTIQFYSLSDGCELHFRKKHQLLKIKLIDGTLKTILINLTLTVEDVTQFIGGKVQISNSLEYSLCYEDGTWLLSHQALEEQGVKLDQILVLKKKLFLLDAQLSREDPIAVHYLYSQARDQIVYGDHPITKNEARDLAALQITIAEGKYIPEKHVPGYFDWKLYLPPGLRKDKNLEKEVVIEFKKLVGMTEMNAKYRYIQVCRALPTWGMTTFNARIPDKKKEKKILIGITRQNIIFMEAETKEQIKSWGLKQLKRYAASGANNTLTLDFGDHEAAYKTILSEDSEKIAALITEYIDLILKTRKDAARVVDLDQDNIAKEEILALQRTNAYMTTTNIFLPGGTTMQSYSSSSTVGPGSSSFKSKPGTMRKLNEIQAGVGHLGALLDDLKHTGHHAQAATMSQQQWMSQMASSVPGFKASVDQFMELLAKPAVTSEQWDEAAKTLLQKAETVIKAARNTAISGKEPNENLLNAAKAVGDSLKNLFSCLDIVRQDPTSSPALQMAMLLSSKAVKAAVGYMDASTKGGSTEPTSIELILEAMKNLEYALHHLLATTKGVSDGLADISKKQEIENFAKALLNTSKVLGASVEDFAPGGVIPECRAFIGSAIHTTSIAMNNLLTSLKTGVKLDAPTHANLLGAAKDCAEALSTLVSATDCAEGTIHATQDMMALLEQLKAVSETMKQVAGNKNALATQIKDVASVVSLIVSGTKSLAESADDKTKARLVTSAKNVGEAVNKLMQAAKTCMTTPHVLSAQAELITSADLLEQSGQDLVEEAAKIYALSSIRQLSKASAAAASSLISYSKRVPVDVLELPQQNQLTATVKSASECIAQLLKCLKEAREDALNEDNQIKLVTAAQESIVPCMDLSAFNKRILPKITDLQLRHDLKEAADRIAQASQKLMNSCKLINSAGGADAVEALEQLSSAIAEMEAAEFAVQTGTLKPTYSQSRDEALALLTVSTRNVHNLQSKVKIAIKSSPKQGLRNMKDLCLAVSETSSAAKTVAALNPDRVTQGRIISSSKCFIKDAEAVVNACKALVANSNNNEVAEALQITLGKLISSTTNLIATSRGFDSKACDEAVQLINEHAKGFQTIAAPPGKDLGSTTDDITSYIKAMGAAVSQLTNMAKTNPKNVGASAKMLASILPSYVESVNIAAALSNNPAQNAKVVEDSKDLFRNMATLVEMTKAYAANPEPSTDTNVVAASKTANEALNQILATLGGKLNNKDCEEAIEQILTSAHSLDEENPSSENANKPTIEVIQDLTSNVKELANVTAQIVSAARLTPEQLGKASKDAAETMHIISNSAKAAGMKVALHPEILAHTRTFKESVQATIEHWEDPKIVLQHARVVASEAKAVLESCKNIAREIPAENAKALITAAQALPTYTAIFARAVQAQQSRQPGAQENLSKTASDLTEHLNKIANHTAMTDPNDKGANPQLHKKLIDHVRACAATTTQLISGAMEVSNKPKDNNALFQLSSASKHVSDAIANLLKACSSLQPGFADCEEAVEVIQTGIGDLDATAIALAVGNLEKMDNNISHQESQEELVQLARAIANGVNQTVNASRFEPPEGIGKAVKNLAGSVPILVLRAKQAVSTTNDAAAQSALLTSAKEIADAVLRQVHACKTVIVNADSKDAHKDIALTAKQVSDAIGAMVSSLKTGVILLRDLDEAINSIKAVIASLDEPNKGTKGKTFDDAKEELNDNAKAFASAIKKVVTADKTNLVQMGNAAKEVAAAVPPLAYACKIAAAAATNPKIAQQITTHMKEMAHGTKALVQHAKTAASDNSQQATQGIQDSFRSLTQGLGKLMDAAKQGAVGEIAIEEAVYTISKTTAALDAALIFAAAGQLEPSEETIAMADLQQGVVAQAKLVGESSTALARSIKGTKEQFGISAKAVADALAKLVAASEAMSKGIGDLSAQQELLGSTKAAVTFSQQLVNAGKDAQRFKQDPALAKTVSKVQQTLNESLTNVVSVAQNAEKDAARGIQQITNTRNDIQKLLDGFDHTPAAGKAAAEDIVKAARLLAAASAQMYGASVDREQVAPASKTGIDASSLLLTTAKAIEASFPGAAEASKTKEATKAAVAAFACLVSAVKELLITGVGQQSLSDGSTSVADRISDLITAARELPGGAGLKLEESAGIDLEETAANELNQACQMIENTIATLIANKPPSKLKTPGIAFDMSNIAEAVYDCCIAIAGAAQKLVTATAEFQCNRVDNQKQNPNVYKKDPMWADGLISAAKSIAGATQLLVKSADGVARGEAKEEEIEAVARSIGGATAQLVAAARVKHDTNSSGYQHLSQAAKSVAGAVTKLVAAAKQFIVAEEEGAEAEQASTYTSNAIKQYEQQMRILRAEKELERARSALMQARKKEYQK